MDLPAVRTRGTSGPPLAVLHGGPGAPGYMAPVARGLAGSFRVAEPLQRWSGGAPLTVAIHVEDTLAALAAAFPGERPAVIGSSWGAMLALCAAAAAPDAVGPLLLVGCGTFDLASRARFKALLEERTDDALRARLAEAAADPDPDRALRRRAALLESLYSVDPATPDLEIEGVDARGNREAWEDMLRLQADGTYPAAFARIRVPVLMIHGAYDPHPGALIRDSLLPFLPALEYREYPGCGHYPWIERASRDRFFEEAREWGRSSVTRFSVDNSARSPTAR
ncbi:MAG: alpha/beta hydrolase, partial [Planctomycetes bacterium]|nr:alpha/beta hydrolase [Planctomycetota bacterium]